MRGGRMLTVCCLMAILAGCTSPVGEPKERHALPEGRPLASTTPCSAATTSDAYLTIADWWTDARIPLDFMVYALSEGCLVGSSGRINAPASSRGEGLQVPCYKQVDQAAVLLYNATERDARSVRYFDGVSCDNGATLWYLAIQRNTRVEFGRYG
jgi:hypothetical protein